MPMYSSGGGGGVKRKVGIIGKQTGDTRKFRSSPGPAKTYKPVKDGLKAMNPGSVDPRMRRLIGAGDARTGPIGGGRSRARPLPVDGVRTGPISGSPRQRPPGMGPIRTLPVDDVKAGPYKRSAGTGWKSGPVSGGFGDSVRTGPVKRRTTRRRTARAL